MKKKMKTFLSWIGGIFIGLVLLTMCGVIEEEETDKKADPKTEQVEAKPRDKAAENPRDKAAEKPKEKTAEEKAAEEKAAAEEKRLAENQAYKDAIIVPFTEFSGGTSAFSEQSTKLSNNTSLMFNQEWVITTVTALYQIREAAHELKAVQPTNDGTKAIQDLMNQIADHYIYVADNYPAAIDNRDIALLETIVNEIDAARMKLEEAILLTENLNNPIE